MVFSVHKNYLSEPTGDCIILDLFQASNDVVLVGGDVPGDYEDVCGDFVNLNMMCRSSLSEMLIGIECACVHSCTMLKKL